MKSLEQSKRVAHNLDSARNYTRGKHHPDQERPTVPDKYKQADIDTGHQQQRCKTVGSHLARLESEDVLGCK